MVTKLCGEEKVENFKEKLLKHLKYCCADISPSCDILKNVVDYCLGSITMISDFVGQLQTDWFLKSSDVTGYINALGHLLDFRRSYTQLVKLRYNDVIITQAIT